MSQKEYKIVWLTNNRSAGTPWQTALNEAAKDCWEVKTCTRDVDGEFLVIFERPAQPKDPA